MLSDVDFWARVGSDRAILRAQLSAGVKRIRLTMESGWVPPAGFPETTIVALTPIGTVVYVSVEGLLKFIDAGLPPS